MRENNAESMTTEAMRKENGQEEEERVEKRRGRRKGKYGLKRKGAERTEGKEREGCDRGYLPVSRTGSALTSRGWLTLAPDARRWRITVT